jgi:threonine synthase
MHFHSTRKPKDRTTLADAMARGLAPDGGLYVPGSLPGIEAEALPSNAPLAELAGAVLAPFFAGDSLESSLAEIATEAYDFPAPLTPVRGGREPLEVLELFHGPTAAFKDFGARFLAGSLSRLQGSTPSTTIVVATSGDTGSAVAAAFHGRPGFEVVILYPRGRVSPRQEQQLTCWSDNVRSFAVAGSFDDCQAACQGNASRSTASRVWKVFIGEQHQHRPPAAADCVLRGRQPRRRSSHRRPGFVHRAER